MATPWTEARLKAFIIAVLRQGTRRYPPKYETLNAAKTEKKINPKTKRLAQHYACAKCKKDWPQKEVQVDHVLPVVDPGQGFVDWNTYITRLFCDKDNLTVLCLQCHHEKTKGEKEIAMQQMQIRKVSRGDVTRQKPKKRIK
jgi:hypothetical protein